MNDHADDFAFLYKDVRIYFRSEKQSDGKNYAKAKYKAVCDFPKLHAKLEFLCTKTEADKRTHSLSKSDCKHAENEKRIAQDCKGRNTRFARILEENKIVAVHADAAGKLTDELRASVQESACDFIFLPAEFSDFKS